MIETVNTETPYLSSDEVLRISNTTGDEVSYSFGDILKLDREYTFSCWMRADSETTTTVGISTKSETFMLGIEWTQVVFTAMADISSSKEVYFTIPSGTILYAYEGQLEEGTKNSDFSYNPDDILESISIIDGKYTALSTSFEVEQGRIESVIQETTIDGVSLKDRYLETVATVDGISTKVSSIETDFNDLTTRVNSAEQRITDDAIVSTVRSSQLYSADLGEKANSKEIISIINQSAESILINASKINLTGYVTISALQNAGSTVINGSNITTGTISAQRLNLKGLTVNNGSTNTLVIDSSGNVTMNNLTANNITVNSGVFKGNISTSLDAYVGNNLYLGDQASTGSKYVYFTPNSYIRRWTLSSGTEYLAVQGKNVANLAANDGNYLAQLSLQAFSSSGDAHATLKFGNYEMSFTSLNGAISATAKYLAFFNPSTGGSGGKIYASTNGTTEYDNLYIVAEPEGYITLGTSGNRWYYQDVDDTNWKSAFYSRDTGCALGKSSAPWYRLYASNSTTVTSDIRLKENIRKFDDRFKNMYMDLKPVIYDLKKFSNGSHCGLIAQWTKEAMDRHGIKDEEFGVFEYNAKDDSYSIAYEELTSYNLFMNQNTIRRVDGIEEDIYLLKEKLSKIEYENSTLKNQLESYINGNYETREVA